jgi:outer membrane protein assembly factor BamA
MGNRARAPVTAACLARGVLLAALQTPVQAQTQPLPRIPQAPSLQLVVEGGDRDDQAYARAAAGRFQDQASFALAVSSVRATDRFREVRSTFEAGPAGPVGRIRVVPWPLLKTWTIQDDGPGTRKEYRRILPELRRGIRAGEARREAWRSRAEQMLRAEGYPAATVAIAEAAEGARLAITIRRGAPARILRLTLDGQAGPYGEARLWKLVEAVPGQTLWTLTFRREALTRLRKRFLKDHRYEWRAEFQFQEDGTLRLQVDPGPVVELKAEGASLGFGGIAELAPLARAERYGPELLDEGDRRIFRNLRNRGYLDPVVSHRRDILEGTEEQPEKVRVTYIMRPGAPVVLSEVRFEGNDAIPEKELQKAANLPLGFWGLGVPKANPDLLQGLEDRIKAHYLRRGYSEIRVRRAVPELERGQWSQSFIIKEGPKRELTELRVSLPEDALLDAWAFGEDLLPLLGDRPPRQRDLEPPDGSVRVFESDRPLTAGIRARIERRPAVAGITTLVFRTDRSIPYVKGDLVMAVAAMRARLSSLGVQRPREDLDFQEDGGSLQLQLTIPDAPKAQVDRLVVQGSDATRARAVLREAELEPGKPLSPAALGQAQARIANLGAFERVSLETMPEQGEGSLALKLSERNPWVFSHSFGYDRSQGYHFGTGVQRLNVGGMGRSVDFGIRAGDATLGDGQLKDKLRELFPTGAFPRSVDIFSLGYSDPRFSPALLGSWIPDRTQYRIEAAYIVERQNYFEFRRRRVLNTFDWRLDPQNIVQVGHRFERSEVGLQVIAEDPDYFKNAQFPNGRVVISAPFVRYVRDSRDSAFDPTRGTYFSAKLEFANQVFGTSKNSSLVKLDVRHQWNWAIGYNASAGVAVLGLRLGVARPTTAVSENFPLSERFFAGGNFTHRGVEPDALGPRLQIPELDPATGRQKVGPDGNLVYLDVPAGGQALALINLEYRFPVYSSWFWGEAFVDSGQVYKTIRPGSRFPDPSNPTAKSAAPFPHFRTSVGLGIIIKLGIPIKIEYAADVKRILGKPRTREEQETELHGVLVSAGFQF